MTPRPIVSSAALATALSAPPAGTTSILTTLFDLVALTKPRLAFFSVLTAATAYGSAAVGLGWIHASAMLVGTTCAAAGALSLNQWWERDLDRLMRRTRSRPLPRAALSHRVALAWSLALGVSGVALLAVWTTHLAALLAAATIVLYGFVYTPLKRRTRWATEIGAIAGALPPLLGGAAAGAIASPTAWVLFAVLFFWQMPHFYAIGWMHRDDYRAARFPLLPAIDESGRRTALWSFGYCLSLLAVSTVPWAIGLAGPVYGTGALGSGGAMLWCATRFVASAKHDRDAAARRLFLASIAGLPVLLFALLLDRIV
ncbi:heme o synthase [Opitutales bacterium ASA1]|uniref:heme o synthase n=1 Tax=Congregicoccus parvus TaxID=3081749 RepID=UPI002B29BE32|nr:heme o synthase [Opitutales bacterium ASA1]